MDRASSFGATMSDQDGREETYVTKPRKTNSAISAIAARGSANDLESELPSSIPNTGWVCGDAGTLYQSTNGGCKLVSKQFQGLPVL